MNMNTQATPVDEVVTTINQLRRGILKLRETEAVVGSILEHTTNNLERDKLLDEYQSICRSANNLEHMLNELLADC